MLVLLESPYASDIDRNVTYARRAMHDSLTRGEFPFASHLLYTQPGILDDTDPDQRALGMKAGFKWGEHAAKTVVYLDYGVSRGMKQGIRVAESEGRPIEYRRIGMNPA